MTQVQDGPEVVEVDASGHVVEGALDQAIAKQRRGREAEAKPKFSDQLIADCREAGIEEFAIKAGGDYRQRTKKKVYWLDLAQLLEFEHKDAEIESDEDFWSWFDTFAGEQQLQTKKRGRSWDDWKHDFDDWKPKSIGSWWSSWGYNSGYGGSSDLTKKLAVALKAVTTTVSVVNDTGKKYRVWLDSELDPARPNSFTSYDNQLIVVSPAALLDTSTDTDRGIEVTTGFALHEASHVKYSESTLAAMTDPTTLRPLAVASLLHNILEDLRIEKLTAEKFPGFADYFTTQLAWLWDTTKANAPATWGPELNDKINAVILMAIWSNVYEPIAKADPELTKQWDWWREWATNYTSNKEPLRMGIVRALERLAEDPTTKKQMQELAKAEEKAEAQAGQHPGGMTEAEFQDMLKGLREKFQQGKGVTLCPSPKRSPAQKGQEVLLTPEQSKELNKLIQEEYQQDETVFKMTEGNSQSSPVIEILKPLETAYSRSAYSKPGPLVERMRSVFFFRKKDPGDTERLLKSGFVDEEELWRAGTGDTRVFERHTQPGEQPASVTMLVDASGSMAGGKLETAQELANAMMACLRTQRGVRTRVRAHTTGAVASGQSCVIYRIWDPGDPDTRIGTISTVKHSSNFDGFAIDWCAKELDLSAQPNETKLLIVLSDGLPAGTVMRDNGTAAYYSGTVAMRHMKGVSEYWARQGVHIVQIAVSPGDLRPEDQAAMFKHWIGYESEPKLLKDLTALLIKVFGGVSS